MLSRASFRRVLQSLLTSERAAARGRRSTNAVPAHRLPEIWPDTLRFSDAGSESLGCDSLERLQLAAAANEMFHLHEAGDEANLLMTDTLGGWLDHIEHATGHGASHVTFLTSGSTGVPKRCCHPIADLQLEAKALGERFADRRRIVAIVPAHHIYGFIFTALLANELKIEVWSAESASPGELARGLRSGDLVVTFPERWIWLERCVPGWPSDIVGATSSAPCPDGLVASLRLQGLAGMVEVYGSSETAGVAWREDPDAAYALMPHWSFAADADGGVPGLVHATGCVAALPDHVVPVGNRSFRLGGRVDGAVQVGGINVHVDRIENLLADRPGVQAAAVRLMGTERGARLKAFIVPDPGTDAGDLENDLSEWLAEHLPAPERPTSFTFGPNLPISGLGKPIDW
jgi:4-coumarate--CoA ligase (photoactive yellow protein activation family)